MPREEESLRKVMLMVGQQEEKQHNFCMAFVSYFLVNYHSYNLEKI